MGHFRLLLRKLTKWLRSGGFLLIYILIICVFLVRQATSRFKEGKKKKLMRILAKYDFCYFWVGACAVQGGSEKIRLSTIESIVSRVIFLNNSERLTNSKWMVTQVLNLYTAFSYYSLSCQSDFLLCSI